MFRGTNGDIYPTMSTAFADGCCVGELIADETDAARIEPGSHTIGVQNKNCQGGFYMARKVKQIAVVTDAGKDYVYSLCEDGTIWIGCYRQYAEKDGTKKSGWCWDEIPGVPDAKE